MPATNQSPVLLPPGRLDDDPATRSAWIGLEAAGIAVLEALEAAQPGWLEAQARRLGVPAGAPVGPLSPAVALLLRARLQRAPILAAARPVLDPDAAAAAERLAAALAQAPPIPHVPRSAADLLDAITRVADGEQLRAFALGWPPVLGEVRLVLLRASDAFAEHHPAPVGEWGPGPVELPALVHDGPGDEGPAYTPDRPWMPDVVLTARHALVWLVQLEARHGRPVRTLDQIPDEALDEIAARGITGLWLVGIFERSPASRTIKQWMGDHQAEASAYAVKRWAVADRLGGDAAMEDLQRRCMDRGIRLGADFVPNHVGLDADWVAEHPDWFLQVDEPPFPNYRFEGKSLSGDDRVDVRIEDHYWQRTDAAVVYRVQHKDTGRVRFIYHGNDGTSTPWNDTAQLDFTRADVRAAVIDALIGVARRCPIVRLDAAMVLAKEHVRRLWHPPPGEGGAIASRSRFAMSPEALDTAMPQEFWREAVDRVAAELPEVLLLAEAFWLLEGWFVRTVGMHRVYNSAFMHMLRDQTGQKHRGMLKDFLATTPAILGRFVQFLSTPDEEPTAQTFGTGDKYFAACTLLATFPGTPLFAHGQMEGLAEQYGMEFAAPRTDEQVDEGCLSWHRRCIVPLLERRRVFAGVDAFELFDLVRDDGRVEEDVYAFTNREGGRSALVLVNMSHEGAAGRIRGSVLRNAGSEEAPQLRSVSLAEALQLPAEIVQLVEVRSGALAPLDLGDPRGTPVELPPYGYTVLWTA